MRWVIAPTSRRYNLMKTFPEWEEFTKKLLYRINDIHLLVVKPKKYPPKIYELTKSEYMKQYGVSIDTIDDYLEEMRKVGFNINLYKWEEPLIIKLIMPLNVHKFLNATIKAKQGEFLLDILLINGDTFEENNDNEENNNNLRKGLNKDRYVNMKLNSIDDINEIYDIVVNSEEYYA